MCTACTYDYNILYFYQYSIYLISIKLDFLHSMITFQNVSDTLFYWIRMVDLYYNIHWNRMILWIQNYHAFVFFMNVNFFYSNFKHNNNGSSVCHKYVWYILKKKFVGDVCHISTDLFNIMYICSVSIWRYTIYDIRTSFVIIHQK